MSSVPTRLPALRLPICRLPACLPAWRVCRLYYYRCTTSTKLTKQECTTAVPCEEGGDADVVAATGMAGVVKKAGTVETIDRAGRKSVGCQTTDTVGGLAASSKAMKDGDFAATERSVAGK